MHKLTTFLVWSRAAANASFLLPGTRCDRCTINLRTYPSCTVPSINEAAPINTNLAQIFVAWGLRKVSYGSQYLKTVDPTDGIEVEYDPKFELADPSAQLHIYYACGNISSQEQLVQQGPDRGASATHCVMKDFKKYVEQMGYSFPVLPRERFMDLILEFRNTLGKYNKRELIGISDDRSRVNFLFLAFYSNVKRHGSAFGRQGQFIEWVRPASLNARRHSHIGTTRSCCC